ncbi:MAG: acetyl-CoA carboxylase biotin carboxyl carrier protein [Treponema sp.]|jgi:acetyl-CoA carboxylase biotin carboxyl carrier protein|nr:acetyl-CoA carboxylase biotin carboxyl carrier protein [Treponema sp.]
MDSKLILSLFDKFNEGSAAELDFNDGTVHFTLKKKEAVQLDAVSAHSASYDAARTDAALKSLRLDTPTPPAAASQAPESAGESGASGEVITSPIVATFYTSPGPDTPPFVTAGSKVKSGDTLCILEAMKMMNKLEAEFNCEILAIKAKSGDMVEYGQPLFEVKRL